MFVCPGCGSRFIVTKAPASGQIKCPKCGRVSPMAPPSAPQESAPAELAPGAVVAGHQVVAYLGSTEYCGFYEASQTSMARSVRLTALRRKYAADESIKAKFFADARAMARLNHSNLLSVFDVGQAGEVCFFTTEFVEGASLPGFLKRQEKLSSAERLGIAVQIARALAYAQKSGMKELWLGPEQVFVSDKRDVRLDRVGTGAPLEGGRPEPLLNVLARLVYMTAAGNDLPQESRSPGSAAPVSMPMARDALGSQFNALVIRLLAEGERAFPGAGEFTAELEKLSESVQRRSTVSATATPGGVVPIRLERARRRQVPVKAVAAGAAVGLGLLVIVLWLIYGWVLEKRARNLWDLACQQARNVEGLRDAALTFRKLAEDYPGTRCGRDAVGEVDKVKTTVVARMYTLAEMKHTDPRDVSGAVAAIRAVREELENDELLRGFSLVEEQAKTRIQNVHDRYERAAIEAWNEDVLRKIQGYCGRMQFGSALAEAQAFVEKWPDSKSALKAVTPGVTDINRLAEEKFNELMAEANRLAADRQALAAIGKLEHIVQRFGIDKYVEQARTRLREIQGKE